MNYDGEQVNLGATPPDESAESISEETQQSADQPPDTLSPLTQLVHVLDTLPANIGDCVVTTLPEPLLINANCAAFDIEVSYVHVLVHALNRLKRLLKPRSVMFLSVKDAYYPLSVRPTIGTQDDHSLEVPSAPVGLIGIPWRIALALMQDGWTLRSDIVWQDRQNPSESNVLGRPCRNHEHIFLFSLQPRYDFKRSAVAGHEDVWQVEYNALPPTHARPALLPSELIQRCLEAGCREAGTVIDPFAHSGATMAVANQMGLNCIAINIQTATVDRAQAQGGRRYTSWSADVFDVAKVPLDSAEPGSKPGMDRTRSESPQDGPPLVAPQEEITRVTSTGEGSRPLQHTIRVGGSEADKDDKSTLLPIEPFARSGEGVTPEWAVYHGDSRDTLYHLPAGTVNCVVTSPPYFWQRDYGVAGQIGKEQTIDGFVQNILQVFRGIKHVLRRDGVVFLNLGDTYYSAKGKPHGKDSKQRARIMARQELRAVDGPGLGLPRKSLIGIPWRVALALMDDGWILRSEVIWLRRTTLPEPTAHDRPWRQYEQVFVLALGPTHFFKREIVRDEEDVWHIEPLRDNVSRGVHYAPFPTALVQRCLSAGCPEGGRVLDPFAGGGTTLVVAKDMGLSSVGVDLNIGFCQFMAKRLANQLPP